MSATTVQLIDKLKAGFYAFAASPARASVTASYVAQYNIIVDGQVKHVVFDMEAFAFYEEAVSNADVEITVHEELVAVIFNNEVTLVDLFAAGKIVVKGDKSLLKTLERHSAKIAAQ